VDLKKNIPVDPLDNYEVIKKKKKIVAEKKIILQPSLRKPPTPQKIIPVAINKQRTYEPPPP
jgi:hypothetical protein